MTNAKKVGYFWRHKTMTKFHDSEVTLEVQPKWPLPYSRPRSAKSGTGPYPISAEEKRDLSWLEEPIDMAGELTGIRRRVLLK